MEKDECGAVQGLACFSKQAGLGNMEWSRIAEFARSNDESAHKKNVFSLPRQSFQCSANEQITSMSFPLLV
jgi:hypothetical protein